MARFKSVTARLLVDFAGRKHQCQHDQRHDIRRGDVRLKVTEGRTDEHFCQRCAIQMLTADIGKLQELLAELEPEAEREAS